MIADKMSGKMFECCNFRLYITLNDYALSFYKLPLGYDRFTYLYIPTKLMALLKFALNHTIYAYRNARCGMEKLKIK